MKAVLKFVILCLALFMLMSSGWVSYSEEKPKECPKVPGKLDLKAFLKAHGIAQENFSIWLQEHSEWRRRFKDELECYSYIPKDFDTERKQE